MTNQESKIKEGLSPAIRWALSLMMLYFLTADLLAQQGVKQNKEGLETFGGQQVMTLNSIDEVDDDNDRITFYADEFRVLDPDDGRELLQIRSGDTEIKYGSKLIFKEIPGIPNSTPYHLRNFDGKFVIEDKRNLKVILEYRPEILTEKSDAVGNITMQAQLEVSGSIDIEGDKPHYSPAKIVLQNDLQGSPDTDNSWHIINDTDQLLFKRNDIIDRFGLTKDNAFFKGDGLEIFPDNEDDNVGKYGVYLNFRAQGYLNWQLSNAKTNNLKFNNWDTKADKWQTSFEISEDGVKVVAPDGDAALQNLNIKPFTVFDNGANLYNESYLNIGAGNGTEGKGKAHIIISPLPLEPVLIRHNPINVPTAKIWNNPIKNGFALAVEQGVLSEQLEIVNRSSWTANDYNTAQRIVVRPPQAGAEIYSATNNLDLGSNGDRVYIRLPGAERIPVLIRYNPKLGKFDSPTWYDQVKGTEESGGFALAVERGVLTEDLAIATRNQWGEGPDWPDYVFQEDYELMPLEELEMFVQEKQHLPGVVSEAKIKEDGFYQMHDAMVGQLKNLEEQVLHNITQEKMIKGQATQIKDQSQKLDQLEKLVEQLSEQVQKLQGQLEK